MSNRRMLSEGVFLSALLVLVFASVNFLLSFASAAKLDATAPAPSVTVVSTPSPKPAPVLATIIALVPVAEFAYKVTLYTLTVLAVPVVFLARVMYIALEPLFFVVQATLQIFVFIPWGIVASIARTLYPVYSFCAVACIVGLVLGWGATLVQQIITHSINASPSRPVHRVPAYAYTPRRDSRKSW